MNRIKVVSGVLALPAGALVQLSAPQASARAHRLEKVKGERGVFKATDVLQFKTGEELGVSELSKRQQAQVEPLAAV